MQRVPAFDGLRALACLGVLIEHADHATHAELPGVGMGRHGVDVFFVLSGYLITTLLLSEKERTRRIRLGRFYLRRAARLYPALVLLVVLCLPLARDFGDPDHGYRLTAGIALAYVTDLWVWHSGSLGGGLWHTWSLAVEEQFYLLWPIVVILTRSRKVFWAASTLGAASLATCTLAAASGGSWLPNSYFLPQTRAWELFAGCALAAWATRPPNRRNASTLAWLAVGVAALMPSAAHVAWLSGVPALQITDMVLITAATVLMIAGLRGPTGHPVERFLSSTPLVWFGQRSYGIYLFQVLGLWAAPRLTHAVIVQFAIVAIVTVAVAAASYRFVERPLQRKLYRRRAFSADPPLPGEQPPTDRTDGIDHPLQRATGP